VERIAKVDEALLVQVAQGFEIVFVVGMALGDALVQAFEIVKTAYEKAYGIVQNKQA
jgi:hypothetical protein